MQTHSKDYNDEEQEIDQLERFKETLFTLFQVDLKNFFELEFILTKQLNLNPLILDQMEYYRIEYMIENYQEWLEKEKEEREKEEGKQKTSFDQSKMMKDAQKMMPQASGSGIPKMPNMGNFKMPKL